MTPGRRAIVWLLPLGIVLLSVVALVVIWGGDLLIPLVASRASAALGRPVTIAHLHISPGRILQATADDVTIGNPPDWTDEPLARVPHLTVQADIWAYIRHGQLVVPLVAVDHPQLTATQLANGAANYKLQLASRSDSSTRIGEVRIDSGAVRRRIEVRQVPARQSIRGLPAGCGGVGRGGMAHLGHPREAAVSVHVR